MPDLIIIAGCNGAGKSTFASSFLPEGLTSFDDDTINFKWKAGYKNVNLHFRFFDNILIVDNSKQNDVYENILQIEKDELVLMTENIPNYFKYRFPEIYKLIKDK